MPYVTPPTQSTGDVIGATQWNRLGSNDIWLAADGVNGRPICRSFRSTGQTIVNNVSTPLAFNNNNIDNAGAHSTSVNPARFYAAVDGYYRFCANAIFTANVTGARALNIIRNGSGIIDSQVCITPTAFPGSMYTESIGIFTAGQYVEAYVHQTCGGNLDVVAYSFATFEWIWKG